MTALMSDMEGNSKKGKVGLYGVEIPHKTDETKIKKDKEYADIAFVRGETFFRKANYTDAVKCYTKVSLFCRTNSTPSLSVLQ